MKGRSWTEVWAEAQRINPWLASPEAEAEGARFRQEMLARVRGHELAELRKAADLTQKEVAGLMGVSQARVSQIEHGQVDSLDNLRAYAAAIGGEVEVSVRQGERTVKVA
ncbi:XRE family transcriptional regulator [Streptomyces rubellomurinus]|uniref:XRE family transcriptional regulator n=1 Tax=Streptomyces rubellomurinus (strain ATCC 31215) TaxID=359131 RepID=A0A0F2TD85_STRR3|nr:XRE family transcriptional regulator [Streptomyces rubellomurinus]KJS61143.1 XRE family transcriptional regulator [Streptomyces rubellomurinus]